MGKQEASMEVGAGIGDMAYGSRGTVDIDLTYLSLNNLNFQCKDIAYSAVGTDTFWVQIVQAPSTLDVTDQLGCLSRMVLGMIQVGLQPAAMFFDSRTDKIEIPFAHSRNKAVLSKQTNSLGVFDKLMRELGSAKRR